MPPSDCGCSGLVTPTLDELLAVARAKPLPRLSVRERRPPPANVGASLKGWLEWRLVDRRGREVAGGECPNLILDQGLDEVASSLLKRQDGALGASGNFPIIAYAAVGTDSGTPDPSDTGLGAELARTNRTFASDAITRPAPGVYRLTKSIEFDYLEANGVLAEWGFSSSASAGSNLFNHALFTDAGGTPDAITKTDQEKLRLAYTLEVALSPVALTPGSFEIAGVGVMSGAYTLVGRDAPASVGDLRAAPDLYLFSALARGELGVTSGASPWPRVASARAYADDLSGVAYTDSISNHIDSAGHVARDVTDARDAYVPGSFERTGGSWKWDTQYGNLDPIRGFVLGGNADPSLGGTSGYGAYAFALDSGDEFSKDDEHTLTVGAPVVTWGRAP